MRKIYEAAVILIGTLCWWGFVYPELCLTEEAYEQDAKVEQTETKEAETDDLGFQIGELRIKSRAVEYVYQVKGVKEKGLEYDEQKCTHWSF